MTRSSISRHFQGRTKLVRWAGLAGVAGSVLYAIGDVLLLGSKIEPENHPILREPGVKPEVGSMLPASTARLTTGAMCGVFGAPLYLAAAWHLHEGLAPAGRTRSLPPALLLAGAWATPAFIHGTFFHWAEAYRVAEELAPEGERVKRRLLRQADDFGRAIVIAYWPFGIATAAASALVIAAVATGRTAYPRWAGPVVAPALPIVAASVVTGTRLPPEPAGHMLQGAGISVGHLISYGASTALLWSGRRLRR
ncbi:hypothetical protein NONO_c42000 [Nocardia nova SH22a]|uniref:Transmembrane protein n=1 Tax=Nocardia nova SH22a TaxID=1415166 RepID=W5TIK8_9NOCA|nr:DUF6796 family protein [Nocardia nova]AHH18984.1 hypothetical protein NONO_c42000 [Nocardia nova SH22a]